MGYVDSHDYSDLDSDGALGERDEKGFADFTCRGSTSAVKKKKDKHGQGLEAGGVRVIEDLIPIVTNPELRRPLKLIADNLPQKSSKSGVQGNRVPKSDRHRRGSW